MRRLVDGCLFWLVVGLVLLLFPGLVLLIVGDVLHLPLEVLSRLLQMAGDAGLGGRGAPGV